MIKAETVQIQDEDYTQLEISGNPFHLANELYAILCKMNVDIVEIAFEHYIEKIEKEIKDESTD